mgnify:CR=1 FL=1|tara:strand:+ start:83 stop:556 length:474 start_codon:yes stop_codon:yes gene_type:complete
MINNNYSDNLILRPAVEEDEILLLNWINDPTVRKWSFSNSDLINQYDHTAWFNQVISDNNIQIWILEKENTPCGQVRVELENKFAVIHYSIDPDFRGNNLGSKMLEMVVSKICLELDVLEIRAFTIPENIASNKSLENAGFKENFTTNKKKCYVFEC